VSRAQVAKFAPKQFTSRIVGHLFRLFDLEKQFYDHMQQVRQQRCSGQLHILRYACYCCCSAVFESRHAHTRVSLPFSLLPTVADPSPFATPPPSGCHAFGARLATHTPTRLPTSDLQLQCPRPRDLQTPTCKRQTPADRDADDPQVLLQPVRRRLPAAGEYWSSPPTRSSEEPHESGLTSPA
jgi:hypothetical protein